MKSALLQIRDSLSAEFPECHIDIDRGQGSKPSDAYPLTYPAILIKVSSIDWSDTTGDQVGVSRISISHYLDNVLDTYAGAPEGDSGYDIIDNIDRMLILHGFSGEGFSLERKRSDILFAENIAKITTEFNITLFQALAQPDPTVPKPEPNFNF